jgi:hypothetical protein
LPALNFAGERWSAANTPLALQCGVNAKIANFEQRITIGRNIASSVMLAKTGAAGQD